MKIKANQFAVATKQSHLLEVRSEEMIDLLDNLPVWEL
jgi:hypothetical protein